MIETATGEDHGTWDSWEEVAMCLAFARLSHDQVEIVSDTSPMASFTGQVSDDSFDLDLLFQITRAGKITGQLHAEPRLGGRAERLR